MVSASSFTEDAARFYLDFHCRLTDHPISLQPVWPLFVEGNYIVKHNQNSMYMLIEGNVAAVKTFPSVTVRQLNYNSSQSKLYEVFCSGRQQLISAGRTQALQYTYDFPRFDTSQPDSCSSFRSSSKSAGLCDNALSIATRSSSR